MAHNDGSQLVGRTVAGKYAVEAVVGEGGFATVYRATHLLWKRPVALKVFRALGEVPESARQKLLDEFVQEGALLADLSARTAAIVQARDIGMLDVPGADAVPYMVLEWLDGSTLEAVLADEARRALPLRTLGEAVRFLDPVAQALALAHRAGVAHRDVKPGNVFVLGDARADPALKLLDFGIAKVVHDAHKMAGTFTKTGGQVTSFTPAYGAPEQFSRAHGATGPWTDVFSLALIVVELVTGREPLQGDDVVQLAVASASAERRPTPRALGAKVSDDVEAVFARALAVRPADRWPSAGDFWSALRSRVDADLAAADRSLRPPDRTGDPAATAPTLAAAVTTDARAVVSAAPPASAAPASRGAGSGRKALVVGGLGLAAAAAVAALAPLLRGHSGHAASEARALARSDGAGPAAATPSAHPLKAAAAERPACPPGMIPIPGGSFFMGDDDGLPIERPAHQVVLTPYCIDRLEVSVAQYKACSDEGRCKRAGTKNEWADITPAERRAYDPLCNARDPVGLARHPVNCVDWDMADQFCREQRKRLPTEAEWEFAARGPDGRRYPWGDEDPAPGLLNACGRECVAWGRKNGFEQRAMYDADDGFPNTAPVGSFPKGASRYGVQDVAGNVWEWVADWYGPYGSEERSDPAGPRAGDEKVIRGGAWNGSYPSWVRPSFRYKDVPTKRSYGIGFRCAADRAP